ncbi:hypothetical protein HPB50_024861 [Hyalomma asiaticum]|uniref:Uncharacterized protein n=1 Tax=Hyalomma asiaticum TaxID=266040 RepID=A0ACB7TQ74_HYAAI|nr:hypothetical protein HPB50_024861 [Hyalomma asiaticum]
MNRPGRRPEGWEHSRRRRIVLFDMNGNRILEAMLIWKKAEKKRLNTITRRVLKVALGLPCNASTELLSKL